MPFSERRSLKTIGRFFGWQGFGCWFSFGLLLFYFGLPLACPQWIVRQDTNVEEPKNASDFELNLKFYLLKRAVAGSLGWKIQNPLII